MANPMRILVVSGYGCHVNPSWRKYMDTLVCPQIRARRYDLVLLCGGETQRKSALGMTEAAVMAIYIRERIPDHPRMLQIKDTYLAMENVRAAAQEIRFLENPPVEEIVLTCERQQWLKTRLLAWRYLSGYPIRVRSVSWEQRHWIHEVRSLVLELVATWLPPLAKCLRENRMRLSETK